MILPRITTRRYYDRTNGKTLRDHRYSLYPSNLLKRLAKSEDICIMVHGMRNDSAGATSKIRIASERLTILRYIHPVIGFSYDSDIVGAHTKKHYIQALKTALIISKKNGYHLASFIADMRNIAPNIRIRLLGHSLGADVIMNTLLNLHQKNLPDMVHTIHLFGASVTRKDMAQRFATSTEYVVSDGISNYYAPSDEVLYEAHDNGEAPYPAGLYGLDFSIKGWQDICVYPENHRFISYTDTLESFP